MATNLETGSETSMTGLVSGIVHDVQELLKQQMALFKAEVQSDMRKTREIIPSLIAGMATVFVGAILLAFTLVHLLDWAFHAQGIPLWVWFLAVGLVVTGIGIGLAYQGLAQFRTFNPLPDETAEALTENLQWTTKPK